MNTHGHESIAEAAGLPLLKEVFKGLGYGENLSLQAFYLGNWITDLSQLVDPVAIAGLRGKLKNLIYDGFGYVAGGVKVLSHETLIPLSDVFTDAETSLNSLRDHMLRGCDSFEQLLTGKDEQGNSLLYRLMSSAALLKAYFKFVHPTESGAPPRMDLEAFFAVFQKLFVQYFPHEHLDRPVEREGQSLSNEKVVYANKTPAQPGIYDYLRDDLAAAAYLLYEVDHEWAQKMNASGIQNLDQDKNWNVGLATLGKAVHAVEDFFAHSNFIEQAALMSPLTYLPEQHNGSVFDFPRRRFLKRLKRYDPNSSLPETEWSELEMEKHVVTGYFDFVDTFISLSHILEAVLFGDSIENPYERLHHLKQAQIEFNALITGSISHLPNQDNGLVHLLDEIKAIPLAHDVTEFFKSAQDLCKRRFPGLMDRSDVGRMLQELPIITDAMPVLKSLHYDKNPKLVAALATALLDVLLILRFSVQTSVDITRYLWQDLKLISSFRGLIQNPVTWLREQITDSAVGIGVDAAAYFSKELLYTAFGLERIGCHSLIAKDHGTEVLADKAKDCATAVHFIIVHTLLRWCRQDANLSSQEKYWVNWMEFLERYLSHPWSGLTCEEPRSAFICVVEQVQQEATTWQDLYAKLSPEARAEVGQLNFEQEIVRYRQQVLPAMHVAKRNVKGAIIYRSILRARSDYRLVVCGAMPNADERWFLKVMREGWHTVKADPTKFFAITFHESSAKADEAKRLALELRRKLEDNYRP